VLDRWCELTAHRSTVGAETRGGVTTFMVMAYIIFVNPAILWRCDTVSGGPIQQPLGRSRQ
jgi:xanthine/uracil/vitamin C permease (AzgA family)